MNQPEMLQIADAVKNSVGEISESHGADPEMAILAALNAAYMIADHFYDAEDRAAMLHRSARLLTALADDPPGLAFKSEKFSQLESPVRTLH